MVKPTSRESASCRELEVIRKFLILLLLLLLILPKLHQLYVKKKSGNGGGYLTSRCAGGCGNTAHTPEAGEVKLQSPDSLGKMTSLSFIYSVLCFSLIITNVIMKIT